MDRSVTSIPLDFDWHVRGKNAYIFRIKIYVLTQPQHSHITELVFDPANGLIVHTEIFPIDWTLHDETDGFSLVNNNFASL